MPTRPGEKRLPDSLTAQMIAPCGMDCGLCLARLRERKSCDGCNGPDATKPPHCVVCAIKTCDERESGADFCFACGRFPCRRLKDLDKRYRLKYGMSMIENLEAIRDGGLDAFVVRERTRWECPECGGVICVHRQECFYCGAPRG
jgi:hypothetical protein